MTDAYLGWHNGRVGADPGDVAGLLAAEALDAGAALGVVNAVNFVATAGTLVAGATAAAAARLVNPTAGLEAFITMATFPSLAPAASATSATLPNLPMGRVGRTSIA